MTENQESVNLRRVQLQNDLDDIALAESLINIAGGNLTKVRKFLIAINNLTEEETDEHLNVLFEQQQESAKDTGKMASPQNIRKVIDSFYEEKKEVEKPEYEKSEYIKKLNVFEVYCSVCNSFTEIKTYDDRPLLLLKEPWHKVGKKVYCSDECWAKERLNAILISIRSTNSSTCNNRLKTLQKLLTEETKKEKSNEMGM